jgi:hypothetical protein
MALFKHLKLHKFYETIEKNYELYFVAADHADALLGKPSEHAHIILDRSKIWNASALSGSSGGVKTASSGSGMAGGAGNAIGGTSDTTSA